MKKFTTDIISTEDFELKGSPKQIAWANDVRAKYIEILKEYEESKALKDKSLTYYPEEINNLINRATSQLPFNDFGEKITSARKEAIKEFYQREDEIETIKEKSEKKAARRALNNDKYLAVKNETLPILVEILNHFHESSFWIEVALFERYDNRLPNIVWGGILA